MLMMDIFYHDSLPFSRCFLIIKAYDRECVFLDGEYWPPFKTSLTRKPDKIYYFCLLPQGFKRFDCHIFASLSSWQTFILSSNTQESGFLDACFNMANCMEMLNSWSIKLSCFKQDAVHSTALILSQCSSSFWCFIKLEGVYNNLLGCSLYDRGDIFSF